MANFNKNLLTMLKYRLFALLVVSGVCGAIYGCCHEGIAGLFPGFVCGFLLLFVVALVANWLSPLVVVIGGVVGYGMGGTAGAIIGIIIGIAIIVILSPPEPDLPSNKP